MNHGSLFSGIGGFDLAAQWMGWDNVFHCEFKEFPKRILKYYWPNAISYHDIKLTDFTIHRGGIDVLSGGFPCQPYSLAGKRKGKADDRHLWPEMLRAISEIQPRWVVGENVYGLINWSGGLVFNEVQADLEAAGYQVWPYVLPACAVNAPHQRQRVWFVAHAEGKRNDREERNVCQENGRSRPGQLPQFKQSSCGYGCEVPAANAGNLDGALPAQPGHQRPENADADRQSTGKYAPDTCTKGLPLTEPENLQPAWRGREGRTIEQFRHAQNWAQWPTQSPVCDGDDGLSARLDFAAVFGSIKHPRQPARAFGKWRNESLMGGGNAIVPQVALQIFQAVQQYEDLHNNSAI